MQLTILCLIPQISITRIISNFPCLFLALHYLSAPLKAIGMVQNLLLPLHFLLLTRYASCDFIFHGLKPFTTQHLPIQLPLPLLVNFLKAEAKSLLVINKDVQDLSQLVLSALHMLNFGLLLSD